MNQIIKRPLVTEKNTVHSSGGIYAFEVARDARKDQIKRAVEQAFRVKVDCVNTMICRGRSRRTNLKNLSKVQYWKKALVKLKTGNKISLFEGV